MVFVLLLLQQSSPSPPIKLSFKTQNSPIILLRPWIYSRISSMETGATVYLPQDTLNIRGTQQILTERINPQCTFPTQMPLAPLGIPITPTMLSGAPTVLFNFLHWRHANILLTLYSQPSTIFTTLSPLWPTHSIVPKCPLSRYPSLTLPVLRPPTSSRLHGHRAKLFQSLQVSSQNPVS